METLRGKISDTVNNLNKLLRMTTDTELEARLRKLRRIYFALWEEVIEQILDNNTSEFKDAIESLTLADKTIQEAFKDIAKTTNAINKLAAAARAVDKVVKLGIDLLV